MKFTAAACQEAANNSPVWQVTLLKPCRSTLFLTRCYLKCVFQRLEWGGSWESHLKKLTSYLNTTGGVCSVLKLRNRKNTDQNFPIRPNKSGRNVVLVRLLRRNLVDGGTGSRHESVDDMLSTR